MLSSLLDKLLPVLKDNPMYIVYQLSVKLLDMIMHRSEHF